MKQYNPKIRGKLFKYFQGRLSLKKSTKGWWRCNCIYCGGNYTFGINLESYRVHCFKCTHQSNPIVLLMDIEGFDTMSQAWEFLNIQQEYDAYDRMVTKEEKIETIPIELPKSFTILMQGDNLMAKAARHYMRKRNFNIKRLSLQGVGYCTEGEYSGYIVFPYYRKGKLVYFQGRRYMGAGPKMKNPMEEIYGVGKSSLIYNEDALFIYNKVYALESITNALTLGDNTIGLSGKSISATQMTKILQSPCENIVIILDPDAMSEAYKMAMQMVSYKNLKVIRLPDNKDVNDIGRKATLEIVKNNGYLKYMDLLRLKNSLNEGSITTHQRVRPNYSFTRGAGG
jgi:hypothetical protein